MRWNSKIPSLPGKRKALPYIGERGINLGAPLSRRRERVAPQQIAESACVAQIGNLLGRGLEIRRA